MRLSPQRPHTPRVSCVICGFHHVYTLHTHPYKGVCGVSKWTDEVDGRLRKPPPWHPEKHLPCAVRI